MIPDEFRELDKVASESLAFLVHEKGCTGPTVEYWRDYFLVYQLSDDLLFKVGMERSWLVPFLFLEYYWEGGLTHFELDKVLNKLGIAVDTTAFPVCQGLADKSISMKSATQEEQLKQEWPRYLRAYAKALREHFDAVIDHVQTSRVGGTVLKEGSSVIGAGSHFMGAHHSDASFSPVDRETFWKITDKEFAVTYSSFRCPSCAYEGNVGIERQVDYAGRLIGKIGGVSWLLAVASLAGCLAETWRESEYMLPFTLAMIIIGILTHFIQKKYIWFIYYCPKCDYCGEGFDLLK